MSSWRGLRERRARDDDEHDLMSVHSPPSGPMPVMQNTQPRAPPPPPPGAQPDSPIQNGSQRIQEPPSQGIRTCSLQDLQTSSQITSNQHMQPSPRRHGAKQSAHDTSDQPLSERRTRLLAERSNVEERAGDELMLGDTGTRLVGLEQLVKGGDPMDLAVSKFLCSSLEIR